LNQLKQLNLGWTRSSSLLIKLLGNRVRIIDSIGHHQPDSPRSDQKKFKIRSPRTPSHFNDSCLSTRRKSSLVVVFFGGGRPHRIAILGKKLCDSRKRSALQQIRYQLRATQGVCDKLILGSTNPQEPCGLLYPIFCVLILGH